MFPIFGTKYDDGEIAMLVEQALIDDPLANAAELQPLVDNGVVSISGRVANEPARRRIVQNIRDTLDSAGVDYRRVDDELHVG